MKATIEISITEMAQILQKHFKISVDSEINIKWCESFENNGIFKVTYETQPESLLPKIMPRKSGSVLMTKKLSYRTKDSLI